MKKLLASTDTSRYHARVRFVQASDFHLHPDQPERLDALGAVVRVATAEHADFLLIPGDLFDAPEVSDPLRGRVRAILEAFAGTTIVVPGNHDLDPRDPARTAFPAGSDYGRRTVVLATPPYEVREPSDHATSSVRIVGVPYHAGSTLGRDLAGLEADPLRTVLLAHGTLHAGRLESLVGGEGQESAYYPIVERDLRGRFAYAALGHVHARATFDEWTADAAWGYAGSPIAITRGELGRRHAVVVDFVPGHGVRDVRRIPLGTPYWSEYTATLLPWDDVDALIHRLAESLPAPDEPCDSDRGLRIRVDGYLDGDETDLRDRLERMAHEVETRFRRVEVDVRDTITVRAVVEQRPWLADLLVRLRRRAESEGTPEHVVRRAAGLLVAAARESSR